jgi:hypothetical protein
MPSVASAHVPSKFQSIAESEIPNLPDREEKTSATVRAYRQLGRC